MPARRSPQHPARTGVPSRSESRPGVAAARLLRWVLVGTLLGVGALGALLVPGAAPAAAATRCGGAVPAGQLRVVVVVDNGSSAPNATCLVVPEGTTGAQLWAARAAVVGTAAPRYASSGLLCAVDGYPATGCGDPYGNGYLYWSYWSGTSGSWVYGTGNPHVRRVRDGDIEGWRFVNGPDGGQNPPPRLAPSRSLFPALPAPPPPPPPAPVPTPAPRQGEGATGTPSGTGVAAPAGEPVAGAAPDGAAPAADPPTGPDAGEEATSGPAEDPGAVDDRAGAPDGDDGDGDDAATTDATELAVATDDDGSSSGGVVGVAVAGVLIAGLATAGILRARARR